MESLTNRRRAAILEGLSAPQTPSTIARAGRPQAVISSLVGGGRVARGQEMQNRLAGGNDLRLVASDRLNQLRNVFRRRLRNNPMAKIEDEWLTRHRIKNGVNALVELLTAGNK